MKTSTHPKRALARMLKAAIAAGPLPGGFSSDIEVAKRLLSEAESFLSLLGRMRPKSRFHCAWTPVAAAMRWLIANPGQEPTCPKIWPELFAR